MNGRAALALGSALLVAVALAAAAGCGSRPQSRRYFSLAPDAPEGASPTSRPRIAVDELDCADPYDQHSVVFRISPVEQRTYRYAMWAAKPGPMVTEVLRRYMAASGRFTIVAHNEAADLELGGRVDVLEQVVEDGRWHGRLELLLTLRRVRDGRVVWQRRIDGMEEARRRDVAEVVAAQSRILSQGLAEALPDLADAAIHAAVGPPAGASTLETD